MVPTPEELLKEPEADKNYLTELINKALDGFRLYNIITSAIELGIFDLLKTPKSLKDLREKLNCKEKLLRIFCEVLCELKLLERTEEGYVDSKISLEFLTEDSFYSQKIFIENLKYNMILWNSLLRILKEGPIKREPNRFFSERAIHSLAQNCKLGELQKTVKIVSELKEFRDARKLLDLGGGHGLYAIAFTAINKNLQAFVFDLPEVVEKTKEYIKMYNAERVSVISGNFFRDDIGENYDIIFSSYNPGGKKADLIPKIYSALNEGGIYINKQIFPQERPFSPQDLEWNFWSFEGIEKGEKIYTFKNDLTLGEYIKNLEKCGFEVFRIEKFEGDAKIIFSRKI
ncbi:MAG: methyltransferase [Archaeoglobales archaeon]|nr:methyltransferase [Archaeoglobales archaeon]